MIEKEAIRILSHTLQKCFVYLIAIFLSVAFLFPIFLVVSNSFMSSFEIINRYASEITPANSFGATSSLHYVDISLIPDFVTVRQYFKFLFDTPLYLGLFWNSVKIVLPVVLGQILVSVPAAYAFEMSKWKHKEKVFFIYIVVMLMPLQVSLVPNYIMAEFLHINGSHLAIVIPGIVNPFGVFLIRQFLKGMPGEYVEAAEIDGAGHFRIICSIILPLIKSAAAALSILTFIEYWNLVDQAVTFIKESTAEPLSVYLSRLANENLDMIFAASCFYMLPAILVFLYGQEYMTEGLRLSGIK